MEQDLTVTDVVPYLYRGSSTTPEREVRTALGPDGDVWFVLSDLCAALQIVNASQAARRLDAEDVATTRLDQDGAAGNPKATIVSEAGAYLLMLRSNRPEARAFRRWITREVLPSIRRHGFYMESDRRAALAQATIMSKQALRDILTYAPTHPDPKVARRLSRAGETID